MQKNVAHIIGAIFFLLHHCSVPAANAQNLKYRISKTKLPMAMFHSSSVYDGEGSIYIIGGFGRAGFSEQVYKFNTGTESLEVVGSFVGILAGAAIMVDQDIIYFGGDLIYEENTSKVHRFSTQNGTTAVINNFTEPVRSHTLVWDSTNQVAYILGGFNGTHVVRGIRRYDAANNRIEQVGELPHDVNQASGFWDEQQELVYVLGGHSTAQPDAQRIVAFNPVTNQAYELHEKLPVEVTVACAVSVKNVAYIFQQSQLLKYNPDSDQGETEILPVEGYPASVNAQACVYAPHSNRLYLFGGSGNYNGEPHHYMNEIAYIDLDPHGEPPTTTPKPPPIHYN